ncbi:transposase [Streptomyces sp. NPDC097107]|uniref:transposase n=1 Tax=Streptomyces sp. NPDC097107 TaxID=3366089 RepID=UPI0038223D0F
MKASTACWRNAARRAAGLRPREPPRRRPGAVQNLPQRARFTEAQGQVSGTRLFLEIQARGYCGSRQVVRKHLAALRAGTAEPVRADIPSPRKITSWIMRPRETLAESQDERLLRVRLACPDIARACDLARTFADLVRHRRGYLLQEWIRQVEQDAPKPTRGFAGFLRQDLDAVTAGLTLPWSSGAVEEHVNRVKTLKRAMYGRASFALLRTRILTQHRGLRLALASCDEPGGKCRYQGVRSQQQLRVWPDPTSGYLYQ